MLIFNLISPLQGSQKPRCKHLDTISSDNSRIQKTRHTIPCKRKLFFHRRCKCRIDERGKVHICSSGIEFTEWTDVACHNGRSRGDRLNSGNRESLVPTRLNDKIGCRHFCTSVVYASNKLDAIRNPFRLYKLLKLSSEGTISRNKPLKNKTPALNQGCDANGQIKALLLRKSTHAQET